MTTAIATNRYQITPDEDAIQQAFVELDEKLSQWTAAMLDAQAALIEPARTFELEEPACDTSELEELYSESTQATVIEEPPMEIPPPATVAEWIEPEPGREQAKTISDAVAVAPEQPPKNAVKQTPAFGEKARASDDVRTESISEDDEKLLASLDQEAAKAIKIMRRLNPGKKTVRELLAEYKAGPTSSPSEQPKKKSWWR